MKIICISLLLSSALVCVASEEKSARGRPDGVERLPLGLVTPDTRAEETLPPGAPRKEPGSAEPRGVTRPRDLFAEFEKVAGE